MKTLLLPAAFLALPAWAVTAPVTEVVLYPGSAGIVRTATVTPGMAELHITGLPPSFNPQSLRIDGAPGVRIGDIVIRDEAQELAPNPAVAELEAKMQSLADQVALLDVEAKSADMVRAYLERFDGGDKQKMALDAKALAALADTLGKSAAAALAKVQSINVQKRAVQLKMAALQRDLARIQDGVHDSRSLTVRVTVEKAATVRLSYLVNNAGWKPAYRAGLNTSSSRIDLERLATVSQKTGEDWNEVKLSLSTSQPRQSAAAPIPQPWLLHYEEPTARDGQLSYAPAPVAMAAPSLAKVAVSGSSLKRGDGYQAPTFQTDSAYATEFEVPSRVNLRADGREVVLSLAHESLSAKQYLRIVPRMDKSATVMAEAERPDGVWPAGNLQLYRDGRYVGATIWQPVNEERASFAFGRDELVQVRMDKVQGKAGSTGVFDKRTTQKMADVFTITSAHTTPVELQVLEASPVSESEQLRVQARYEPKPTETMWEQKRGVLAWRQTLAPKQSTRIQVEYDLDYPREGSITGMR